MQRRNFIKGLFGGAGAIATGMATVSAATPKRKAIYIYTDWLAGTAYYSASKAMTTIEIGQPLLLKREPQNPYDDMAIEVFADNGLKLGYLPKVRNHIPARLIDAELPLMVEVERLRPPKSKLDSVKYSYWDALPGVKVKVFLLI